MKAWELLEQKGWCQGDWAKNRRGASTIYSRDSACSFCLLGSIYRVYEADERTNALARIASVLKASSIAAWNDAPGRTKEEVIAALKAADV